MVYCCAFIAFSRSSRFGSLLAACAPQPATRIAAARTERTLFTAHTPTGTREHRALLPLFLSAPVGKGVFPLLSGRQPFLSTEVVSDEAATQGIGQHTAVVWDVAPFNPQ